ncbi:PDR/VanB family oxidoreductase [Litorihabitans aurantiacus]|uniref:Ferredoxin n=1 Tax=Litorihabitans aurantiacus TaxID=1930061 RepID=A0AA37UWW8_9MICO|nr:PDR/VanB family oxidoreductase [Litorihabitans aurantiacus]GMA31027.1 ferredoxin [Litorihabitans aurantiacus]
MSFFSDVERELTVIDRTPLTADVVALDLAATNGRPLPVWTPGAHVDLEVAPGVERQYSLCGDLADRTRWRVAILREPAGRGGSLAAHALAVGTVLRARGPRSNFAYEPRPGSPVTFVAGGVGITAVLPMLSSAAEAGADWELHYCGRERTRMAWVEDLAARHGARVHVHDSAAGDRLDVSALVRRRGTGGIWACGPAPLLDALHEAAASVPGAQVHVEHFTPQELSAPVWEGPFEVELAASGEVVVVPPQTSVLEALESHGAITVSSCREGTCGTCETVVLEGDVDHRDSVLTQSEREENLSMMTCVSRAACPRLVLDL